MKLFFLIALFLSPTTFSATPRGSTAVMGPATMGYPNYPSSGDSYRTDDTRPAETSVEQPAANGSSMIQKQEQKDRPDDLQIGIGPYDRNGKYNYLRELIR